MTTVKKKNKEEISGINTIIKKIIKEDDVETLLSMIQNWFDINTFKYKNSKGIDAFILYKYDSNKANLGKVLNSLLVKVGGLKNVSRENQILLNELYYNEIKTSKIKSFNFDNLSVQI